MRAGAIEYPNPWVDETGVKLEKASNVLPLRVEIARAPCAEYELLLKNLGGVVMEWEVMELVDEVMSDEDDDMGKETAADPKKVADPKPKLPVALTKFVVSHLLNELKIKFEGVEYFSSTAGVMRRRG